MVFQEKSNILRNHLQLVWDAKQWDIYCVIFQRHRHCNTPNFTELTFGIAPVGIMCVFLYIFAINAQCLTLRCATKCFFVLICHIVYKKVRCYIDSELFFIDVSNKTELYLTEYGKYAEI